MTLPTHHATPPLSGVHEMDDGSLRIGGATSLASIGADAMVRERYAALALACEHPDRAQASRDDALGIDLARRGRCPYLAQGAPCLKNGGTTCLAIDGDNRLLAILDGGPSWIIHPSDAGVALVALDARIAIAGPRGARDISAADFFVLPTARLNAETVLDDDEQVIAVYLPPAASRGLQLFLAERDAASHELLVSLAAVKRMDGEVRLVLGSVSPRPYRVYNSIEEETTTGGLDDDTIEGLAERALLDADPLSANAYKIEIASRLLREAIRTLAAG